MAKTQNTCRGSAEAQSSDTPFPAFTWMEKPAGPTFTSTLGAWAQHRKPHGNPWMILRRRKGTRLSWRCPESSQGCQLLSGCASHQAQGLWSSRDGVRTWGGVARRVLSALWRWEKQWGWESPQGNIYWEVILVFPFINCLLCPRHFTWIISSRGMRFGPNLGLNLSSLTH